MKKEKSEGEGITYLGTWGTYHIFTQAAENMIVNENEERYAVMNAGMFHKQTHICKDRKSLWRKIRHNKEAKKLCQIFNRDYK